MNKIIRKNYKIDATDRAVGRLATEIAVILRGKNTPEFNPAIDGGGIVEVANIKKVKFSGKKLIQKKYFRYSGYPSGLKEKKLSDTFASDPAKVLSDAVKEMLPPVSFRPKMLRRLIIK